MPKAQVRVRDAKVAYVSDPRLKMLHILIGNPDRGVAELTFKTPVGLLSFLRDMLDEAAKVWPENEYLQEYLREE